jgi:hypothetical protein
MVKKILILIILVIGLNANEVATKNDIQMLSNKIEMLIHQIDKRFEQVDKRFEQVDRRFKEQHQLSLVIIAGMFGMVGFMMWDRRTQLAIAKKEVEEKVKKEIVEEITELKTDKIFINNLLKAVQELAQKDEETKNLLAKHHLQLAA